VQFLRSLGDRWWPPMAALDRCRTDLGRAEAQRGLWELDSPRHHPNISDVCVVDGATLRKVTAEAAHVRPTT
jgi:hypothetical protein